MNRQRWLPLVLILLPLLGALLGRAAAPRLARMDYTVQVAERIWLEETRGLADRTKQSEAFRTLGLPIPTLYAQAAEVRARFRLGGTLFGLWCGLIAALRLRASGRTRPQAEYDADPAHCLACGRCFESCPVERERRKEGAS